MSARMVIDLPNGNKVLFGSTGPDLGLSEVGLADNLAHVAGDRFQSALGSLAALVETLQNAVERMAKRPEKVELEFSASLTAKGDLWVVSGEGEAEFKVTLGWGKSD